MMQYHYQILDQEEGYHGFFKVTRYTVDFDYFTGGRSGPVIRECLGRGFVVAGLPYDPVRDEFVFVEQFRIGLMAAGEHPWNTEIVAGFMDKPGESPEDCMQRELQEEIGTTATRLHRVAQYFGSPGGSGGQTILFFAEVDASTVALHTGLHEEAEDIRVVRVPRKTAMAWLKDGKVSNATMLLALQAFALSNNQIPEKGER